MEGSRCQAAAIAANLAGHVVSLERHAFGAVHSRVKILSHRSAVAGLTLYALTRVVTAGRLPRWFERAN